MNITKAELFIQAHIIAKTTRNLFPSYNGAFSFALITIYAEQRALTALSPIQIEQKEDAARAEAKMKADAIKVRELAEIAEKNAAFDKRIAEINRKIKLNDLALKALEAQPVKDLKPSHIIVHWSESNAFGENETLHWFNDFEKIAYQVAQDNGDMGYTKTKITVHFDDEDKSSYGCRLDLAVGDEVGFQDHMEQMINYFHTCGDDRYKRDYSHLVDMAGRIDYRQAA